MLLLLLLVVYSANSYALPPQVQVKNRHGRSIGSVNTTIESHPYSVQIEKNGKHNCGGTIISKHLVLTAAHCLAGQVDPLSVTIRTGTSLRGVGGNVHYVIGIMIHELFSVTKYLTSKYDVALAFVLQPFDCNSINIQSIDLYKDVLTPDQELDGKAVMTGWGQTSLDGPLSDNLLALEVPVYSKSFCNDNYEAFGGIYEGQICAGYVGVRNVDVCRGDSGSPLVYNGKLIGIVAYGEGQCGHFDHPTVYTEVAYVYDWINEYLNYDQKCE